MTPAEAARIILSHCQPLLPARRPLREALDAVLEGRSPERAETEPIGCSIKWKP